MIPKKILFGDTLSKEIKFWMLVDKTKDVFECWLWRGRLNEGGYGTYHKHLAHRMMYEKAFGSFNKMLAVCHRCDNPKCVNPFHLFLGTRADNNYDRNAKGRNGKLFGENNKAAILTEEKVKEIRLKFKTGKYTKSELAKEYGVSDPNIGNIIKRKTWTQVSE